MANISYQYTHQRYDLNVWTYDHYGKTMHWTHLLVGQLNISWISNTFILHEQKEVHYEESQLNLITSPPLQQQPVAAFAKSCFEECFATLEWRRARVRVDVAALYYCCHFRLRLCFLLVKFCNTRIFMDTREDNYFQPTPSKGWETVTHSPVTFHNSVTWTNLTSLYENHDW